jgi:hypothetical protein
MTQSDRRIILHRVRKPVAVGNYRACDWGHAPDCLVFILRFHACTKNGVKRGSRAPFSGRHPAWRNGLARRTVALLRAWWRARATADYGSSTAPWTGSRPWMVDKPV